MCGICGYIRLDNTGRPSEAVLRGMMDAIAHRGPDDSGMHLEDNVALGHRRLSIIDLETGHQPLYNEDRSIAIVYNGEVYNFRELKEDLARKGHRFLTHSDTEVIVHAYEEYGEDCLGRFNGMFAFAIWDSKEEKLFLARDRFGKKPLYYCVFDNQFIFGSELKAVLKHPSVPREIDRAALLKYLAYDYVPAPLTIFDGIKKLEAGCKLTLKDKDVRIGRYWDPVVAPADNFDLQEAKSKLLRLLKGSVEKRLISDVPLGVFLSGGIDSSAVVAMMAELMPAKDIKTFSIGFKESSYDESLDARRIADHFRTDHHEEVLGPEKMLEILPKILDILDEPFADSSIIPTYLVADFTRKHVKVALGGDGGDELFLGYPSFRGHRLNARLGFLPDPAKALIFNVLAGTILGSNSYAKRFARGLKFPDSVRQQVWIGTFTPDQEKGLFLGADKTEFDELKVYDKNDRFFGEKRSLSALDRAIYIYLKTYMTDDILAKVDRASMANSLEVRAPFLDAEFAEFALGIPAEYKLRGSSAKWILKDAFKDKLPEGTLNKPKHGFAVPVGKWLKEDLKGLLSDLFNRRKIEREGLFDYNYIEGLMAEHATGRKDRSREIWSLFMFESWYDRWM